MKIGIIGAGEVGRTLARRFLDAGASVTLCNSRSPDTLADTVRSLGEGARAGSLTEAASCEVVVLAVWWDAVPRVMEQIPDWGGRILIDATNQLTFSDGKPRAVHLDGMTGSEYVASLAKGARVVKAFNSLFAAFMDGATAEGNRVLFYADDDAAAKKTLAPLFGAMGFYPMDLGGLSDGGRLMQVGGALNGKHFIKRTEDRCL